MRLRRKASELIALLREMAGRAGLDEKEMKEVRRRRKIKVTLDLP
jgi:hypothetical protein